MCQILLSAEWLLATHGIDNRLPEIDVLRGLAAMGVFTFHVSVIAGFPKRTLPPIGFFGQTWSNVPSIFSFGATGVSLFFVISGFCLALKRLRRAADSIAPGKYARDRFARIYPAYFVAVAFSLLIAELRDMDWSVGEVVTYLVFLQGFTQKWHFSLNGALWSMATEVQFYAMFPLLFAAFARLRLISFLGPITLAVMGFRVGCTLLPSADVVVGGINTATFLMNTLAGRLLDFALGICLAGAWLAHRETVTRLSRVFLSPALVLGVVARSMGPTWLADPALGLMCAVLVGYVVTREFRIDGHAILAAFGRSSYSFFLLHFPILALVAGAGGWISGLSIYRKFYFIAGVGFVVTLILSVVLYRFVEVPCMRYVKSR